MRRTKEFDRSNFFGDIFAGTIPDHHIRKLSQDPKFKSNRALVKDLMTPAFLNNVSNRSPATEKQAALVLMCYQGLRALHLYHIFPTDRSMEGESQTCKQSPILCL